MHFELSDEQQIPIEIRRRKGTRYLKLSIGQQNQILVSVPWRCSDREALKFADKQRAWLETQLGKVPAVRSLSHWLEEHPRISGSGDIFTVQILRVIDRVHSDYVFDQGGSVIVLRIPEDVPDFELSLLQLVRRFAKDALACRVAYQAKRLDLAYNKLSVRDQASRWGSCSCNGGISLNWRLVLLEPELQDYVIFHELAHLTQMNHSSRFWALLDTYDPDRVRNDSRVDTLTAEYMRVGRSS
ncbi:MAG: M48 family metallopeptidase [Lentimonas sp.]